MHARVRADRARFQVSVGYRSGQIFLDLEGSTVRDGAFRCNWVAFRCSFFFFFFFFSWQYTAQSVRHHGRNREAGRK